MLDSFTRTSAHEFFLETGTRRAFLIYGVASWWWLVTDLSGKVLAGQRDWRMDAFEAADRAVDWLRTEATDRLHMEGEPR